MDFNKGDIVGFRNITDVKSITFDQHDFIYKGPSGENNSFVEVLSDVTIYVKYSTSPREVWGEYKKGQELIFSNDSLYLKNTVDIENIIANLDKLEKKYERS